MAEARAIGAGPGDISEETSELSVPDADAEIVPTHGWAQLASAAASHSAATRGVLYSCQMISLMRLNSKLA